MKRHAHRRRVGARRRILPRRLGRLRRRRSLVAAVVAGLAGLLVSRLLARLFLFGRPTSILGDIGKLFDPVAELGEEIAEAAEAAFHSISIVWSWLREVGNLLSAAWNWVLKGVDWFVDNAEHFAEEVFGTIWHIITHTIPEVAEWVYKHAILWALHEVEKLAKKAWHWVQSAIRWAERELHKLRKLAEHWVNRIFKWAEHAVWWVEHRAARVWYYITHPEKLALLLVDHLLLPLVKRILRSGAHIVVTLLRDAARRGSSVEHFFEDILHDML